MARLPLTNIFAKAIETTRNMFHEPVYGVKAKQVLQGTVLRKSGDKTINVVTPMTVHSKKYRASFTKPVKRLVHDPYNLANIGDEILFQQVRKFTEHKHWILTGFKRRDSATPFIAAHKALKSSQRKAHLSASSPLVSPALSEQSSDSLLPPPSL
eukprot:TRINITY_DN239_c0_g2_i1.p1 TRINITY_DN239_c0_g2~~TRINITY_DN239_c0_g2_i1.p1  ORF type:complete len:173 (+),score=86.51 TRINITY_DN239_c0_g2_i1:55-519(+)